MILTAGARADRWTIRNSRFSEQDGNGASVSDTRFPDRDGREGSFRGGALWRIIDAFSARAAGYTGFRLPTLNELYRGFTVFPVRTDANAALAPERLKGVEVGIDFKQHQLVSLSATAFYNRLDNAIANVTVTT